ncbi:Planctomycete cytochrome C [Planctomycetes bacterium MalM25]|nr:Planctomycete cytochrome C [Planctomycetes bacterium MalM25]
MVSPETLRRGCLLTSALSLGCGWLLAVATAEERVSFNREIRPILSDRCYYCHGFDEHTREADLRLDREADSRAVIEPGVPEESELLRRVLSDDEYEVMPPPDSHKAALSTEEIDVLRRWISEGARYEPHWAFVAPARPDLDLSVAEGSTKSSTAIDHYVAKQQESRGLQPAKPAAPAKWLRRVSLDLTGLPPTSGELVAFENEVAERGEAAYADAVDRLLASPHYGERMALDWLDVARYADTNGFQHDAHRMNWPWRDWVTRAFNENMPFDQFTIEQLAGDLLEEPTTDQLVATAFNRNHMINGEGGAIREENLAKTAFDRVETTGTAWLGLTVGCCQCHDHKFDPIKQSDYYQLFAFFNQTSEKAGVDKQFSSKRPGAKRSTPYMVDRPYISLASDDEKQRLKELQLEVKHAEQALEAERPEFEPLFIKWVEEMREDPSLIEERVTVNYLHRFVNTVPLDKPSNGNNKKLTRNFLEQSERWRPFTKRIDDAKRAASNLEGKSPLVMIMRDDKPRDTFILLRGNYETPGDQVTAGVPGFLPPLPQDAKADRLALARWLVSEEQPLTTRVTVNRLWQLMFGRGLVPTPDDFGLQGDLPTHPDLLEWLACEFRTSGWDVKAMLKGIALSKAYRQSSEVSPDSIDADPDNRWLTRGPRRRLDSRLLRDQTLALSGLLNREQGGPPVFPYQPPGIWEEMSLGKNHYEQDHGEALYRRSLYTVWRRVVAPANFFDVPSRQVCSVKPQLTSTPLHALTLLNDPTYVEAARVWAGSLLGLSDDDSRLREAFFAATARRPEARELETLQATLDDARRRFAQAPEESIKLLAVGEAETSADAAAEEHAAWTTVCLLILNLDETLSK